EPDHITRIIFSAVPSLLRPCLNAPKPKGSPNPYPRPAKPQGRPCQPSRSLSTGFGHTQRCHTSENTQRRKGDLYRQGTYSPEMAIAPARFSRQPVPRDCQKYTG